MFLCSLTLNFPARSQFSDFNCDEGPDGKAAGRGDRSSSGLRTLSTPSVSYRWVALSQSLTE